MRKCSSSIAEPLPRIAVLVAFACMCCSGCHKGGYERVPVSGHVLIDGAPLTVGYVRFIPIGGGRPSVTNIGADGRFDFGKEGVVVGKQRVEVIASEQVGATGYRWHAPEKYASYSSSGLEQEISQPTSDLMLKLTWDGGKPFTAQSAADEADPKSLRTRK
jgi:hypothetical protein